MSENKTKRYVNWHFPLHIPRSRGRTLIRWRKSWAMEKYEKDKDELSYKLVYAAETDKGDSTDSKGGSPKQNNDKK
jgi:hypothetical protein